MVQEPFVFEFPSANGTFLGLFTFEFSRDLVVVIELRRNVTPTVVLTEIFFNGHGTAGVENLSQFRIYNISVTTNRTDDFVDMRLNLTYDEKYLNRSGFYENTLGWYSYQPLTGNWTPELTVLDTENNNVLARVDHTSIFGVFGERNLTMLEEALVNAKTAAHNVSLPRDLAVGGGAIFVAVLLLYIRHLKKKARRPSESTHS